MPGDPEEKDDEGFFGRPGKPRRADLEPPAPPRTRQTAPEPDYGHPLLQPLARAQDAMARLETALKPPRRPSPRALRARLSYREAAGWLALCACLDSSARSGPARPRFDRFLRRRLSRRPRSKPRSGDRGAEVRLRGARRPISSWIRPCGWRAYGGGWRNCAPGGRSPIPTACRKPCNPWVAAALRPSRNRRLAGNGRSGDRGRLLHPRRPRRARLDEPPRAESAQS